MRNKKLLLLISMTLLTAVMGVSITEEKAFLRRELKKHNVI